MGLILGRAEALDEATSRSVEQFLYREVALLDDKNWQGWLALYTEDCFYWVPSTMDQADPINTISLFAENRMMMEMRIIRISHPRAFSQEFPTRTSHLVGNVTIETDDGTGHDGGTKPRADIVIRSSLHVLEYRKEEQRMFGGTVRHWLRRDGTEWKIALKRIDLINCDAPMETVQLFL
jgi:3-phenylpropionate/cinnamic acid dioxygenase small subunit